eukprot:Em0134g6a
MCARSGPSILVQEGLRVDHRTLQLKKNASYGTELNWEVFLCNLEWIGDEMADQKFPVKSLTNTTAQKDAVMHCHKHGEAQRELWSPSGRTPQLKKNASYGTDLNWEVFLCNLEWIGDEMADQKFPVKSLTNTTAQKDAVMHCHKHGEAQRELWSPSGRTPQLKKNASYGTDLNWEVFLCNLEWIGDEMADQKFPVKSLTNTTAQKDAVMHCHKHGEAQRELWSPSGRTPQLKKNASYGTDLNWEVFLCNLEWIGDEMADQKFPRTPQLKKNASYGTDLNWEVFLCNLEWIGDEMADQKFPVKSLTNTTAQKDAVMHCHKHGEAQRELWSPSGRTPQLKKNASYGTDLNWEVFLCNLEWIGDEMEDQKFPRTPQHKRMLVMHCHKHGEAQRELWSPSGRTPQLKKNASYGTDLNWEVFLCNLEWIGDEMADQKFPVKSLTNTTAQKDAVMHCHKHGEAQRELWSPSGRTPQLKKNASYGTDLNWEVFLCNLEWIGDEMEDQKFPVKSLTNTTAQKDAVMHCHKHGEAQRELWSPSGRTPQLKKNASYGTDLNWEVFLCNLEWIGDEMADQKFPVKSLTNTTAQKDAVMHCHKHGEAQRELWSPSGRTPQLKKNASYGTDLNWEVFLCNLEWIGDEMADQKFPVKSLTNTTAQKDAVMHCHKHGEAQRELWSPSGRTPQLKKNASYGTDLNWEVFLCNLEWIGDEMADQKFPVKSLTNTTAQKDAVMHCHKHGEAQRELWSPSGRTPQLKKNASYGTDLNWEVFLCNLEWIGDEMADQKFPVKSLTNTTAQKDAVMHCHKHGEAQRELWSPSGRTPQLKKNASYGTDLNWEVFLCNLEWIGDEMADQKFPRTPQLKKNASYGTDLNWEVFLCNLEWIGDEMADQKFPVKSLTNTTAQKDAVMHCHKHGEAQRELWSPSGRTPQLKKNASYGTDLNWEVFLCNLEWIGDEMEDQKFPRTPQHKRMLVMHCHKHGEAQRELWSPSGRTPQLKKNASYGTDLNWEVFLCNLEWIGDEMADQKFPVKSLTNTTAQKDAVMHCHKHGEAQRELWSPSGRTPQLKKNASYGTDLNWEVFLCNLEWIGDEMEDQKFPVKSLSKNKHVTYRHFYLANTTAQKDAVMHCHEHGEAQRELWSPSGRTPQHKRMQSCIATSMGRACVNFGIHPLSKEYRELRVTFSRQNLATWDPVSNAASNWLVVQNDHSRALLYLGAHKTSRKTGPNRIQLNSTDSTKNSRGEPFGTSDSWTKYIQSIFKQLANVAISSNALRSSFVTDLLTSRNRPSDDLLAEVAFAMRHSSLALTSERVATALDVTTAAAPAPVATTTSSKRRRRADDDDNVAPEVGDIVGAVDDSSTLRKPFVHFASTAGRSKTYRLRIGGGTWIEPFDSLVYPVDMTYNTSSCVYTLRTPLHDIHVDVLGQPRSPSDELS